MLRHQNELLDKLSYRKPTVRQQQQQQDGKASTGNCILKGQK